MGNNDKHFWDQWNGAKTRLLLMYLIVPYPYLVT